MTREEVLNALYKIEKNTVHNGYMWATDVKELVHNVLNDHEAQFKALKEKIEELDKLGSEIFMIDLLHGKDYKARSIVAMLFWEWKKRKRLYIANGHRSGNAGWGLYEQTNLMEVVFKKSYKMLKDTKCY